MENFQFKIISKFLVDRLAYIAPRIISNQQRGFLRDRSIFGCICITSKAVNLLNCKSFKGNIAMKSNIRKSFDTLDWAFLAHDLKAFRFCNTLCSWVRSILESARLSFSINDFLYGYLSCKGIRSLPFFFAQLKKFLSRGIPYLFLSQDILPMASPRNYSTPTHLLYVDDIMVFCRAKKKVSLISLTSFFLMVKLLASLSTCKSATSFLAS